LNFVILPSFVKFYNFSFYFIDLQKAEVDKQLISLKATLDQENNSKKESEELIAELRAKNENLITYSVKCDDLNQKLESIEALNKQLLNEIALLQKEKKEAEASINEYKNKLQTSLNKFESQLKETENKAVKRDWHFLGSYCNHYIILSSFVNTIFYFLSIDIILSETQNLASKLNVEAESDALIPNTFSTPG